jgi:hypothetical protein
MHLIEFMHLSLNEYKFKHIHAKGIQLNAKIYKCFIASPSDTQEERDLADNVFNKLNKSLGEHLEFRIESIKWENNARPSFGSNGQDVINRQLLNDYHIFIGIMWNKFGTPTTRAGSGSEEEFDQAYKKLNGNDDLEILLYFNDEAAPSSTLDLAQVKKIREFKEKVWDLGALTCEYQGAEDFSNKLEKHLYDYFVSKLGSQSKNPEIIEQSQELQEIILKKSVAQILKNRFNEGLSFFSNQPVIWVEPSISKTNKLSKDANQNQAKTINPLEVIESKKSYIIKAPPQFGLTSLSHYLVKEGWESNEYWVYLDAKKMTASKVGRKIANDALSLGLENTEITGIILDSWSRIESGSKKLLQAVCEASQNKPVLIMQTIDDAKFSEEDADVKINKKLETLHLLSLPRSQMRKVVSNYNNEKHIGEDNVVLNKLLKDMDALNIHRTASNCLTLLKVSEKNFDESPINRTKMIEMVLFALFDLGDVPTYKSKPDVKDCEHVLGKFCEDLIAVNEFSFTRQAFIKNIKDFCDAKLLDLETDLVFDILFKNNIIIESETEHDFCFRSSYWIFYFAAKRMYVNDAFYKKVLDEELYVSFPEIIEFYTGIDRNRTEILEVLIESIEKTCRITEEKTGLPDSINPLELVTWKISPESIEEMKSEISEDVKTSNLPENIKDRHADSKYDQLKPYDQSINTILEEYSFSALILKIKACSRALRNSDYVEPDMKRKLLKEITRGWKQVSKILFALAPILAEHGRAEYDGQGFTLCGEFGDSINERLEKIFLSNLLNVVELFKEDLFSEKIGPLLFDAVKKEEDRTIKHLLILLIISERPGHWKKHVQDYISTINKDSFYLMDTVIYLKARYQFDFATEEQLRSMRSLLKMAYAKHEFGKNRPNAKEVNRISNSVIPERKSFVE